MLCQNKSGPVLEEPVNQFKEKTIDLTFNVKRLTESSQLPTQANPSDAGWDLYADEDVKIWPGETKLISTGISLEIPDGYVGLIWDRSSMGVKGIHRHAGVIDSGYRGEVKVCLHNSNPEEAKNNYVIETGDRIAQIIIQQAPVFEIREVKNLEEGDRGNNGFGSSGR